MIALATRPHALSMSVPHHSIASSSPSPFSADVLNIAHVLFFRAERPRALEISDGDMAPSMSWGEDRDKKTAIRQRRKDAMVRRGGGRREEKERRGERGGRYM